MTMDIQFDQPLPEAIDTSKDHSTRVKRKKEPKPRKAKTSATPILHFLSTQPFASPFDVNMAVDSGFKVIIPHTNVGLSNITPLVQDAIFSRPPHYGCRTGIFIGGKDALLALDMIAAAKAALVPPFELSAFADPGGSFTTAAAMVAWVEHIYQLRTGRSLKGASVAIFGATGVVGFASAIIVARCGAKVKIVSHIGLDALKPMVQAGRERFNVALQPVLGARDGDKTKIAASADIILCAAAAGVRVLERRHIAGSKKLAVVADVNAVPPSGIDGVELFDRGRALPFAGILSVGPLAIGDVKYQTQSKLFQRMVTSETSVMFDFTDAFVVARQIVAGLTAEASKAPKPKSRRAAKRKMK